MQNAVFDDRALRLLACPVCYASLALSDAESGFAERVLLCTGCGRRYPIRDGLPVLLGSAALP